MGKEFRIQNSEFRRECRYHLILSQDLEYGRNEEPLSLLEETSKVLNSYAKAILNSDS
jgi:hypothetical protein